METELNNHPCSIHQDGLKKGPKKQKTNAVLCSLLSRLSSSGFALSECIMKRHELVIADVQSSCMGHYLSILIFAGVRRQTLASPQSSISLPLPLPPALSLHPSLPLFLSLSLTSSPVYLHGDWVVVLLSDLSAPEASEPLCAHPLCLAYACIHWTFSWQKTKTTNCSNDVNGA